MDTAASTTLHFVDITMGLAGGLAMFLFGMEQMTSAMKLVAGSGMKNLLARMTSNRIKAATTGAFVTAVVNSSSVTTVLVVGFISAGLMSLSQSVGIIFGANVGSTFTAQLIAFKITSYSLLMIAAGFGMHIISRNEKIRYYGLMLLGLGLLFFGMSLMSDATRPLRTYQPFIDLMQKMNNPVLGIIIGAFFTAVIQSSGATTGIVIVLASQGFITLEAGIALAFGANIGTCITALLASIGKPREAIQAAVVHILFNVIGVIIWVGFIDQLAELMRFISPKYAHLEGLAQLAAESPRQIANAHTTFNIANTIIFLSFTRPMASFVEYLLPARAEEERVIKPKYINTTLLETPDIALHHVRLELERMRDYILPMMDRIPSALIKGTRRELQDIRKLDDAIDSLHSATITFLGLLSQESLTQPQIKELHELIAIANYFENIGDIMETNMVTLGMERLERNIEVSESTLNILDPLFSKVYRSVEKVFVCLTTSDKDIANEITSAKSAIHQMAAVAHSHLAKRLTVDKPNRLEAFRLETDIIENLRHIYYFAKKIAKIVVEIDVIHEETND